LRGQPGGKARFQLVEQRCSIIEALAKGYERGQTENYIELLLKIQSAIGAQFPP
jgi:hypothetical protein